MYVAAIRIVIRVTEKAQAIPVTLVVEVTTKMIEGVTQAVQDRTTGAPEDKTRDPAQITHVVVNIALQIVASGVPVISKAAVLTTREEGSPVTTTREEDSLGRIDVRNSRSKIMISAIKIRRLFKQYRFKLSFRPRCSCRRLYNV